MPTHRNTERALQDCIDACQECASVCERTARHCLGMGGEHASPAHQTLLRDCAHICATAGAFMARGSEHHHLVCGVCAELCVACAEDCERLAEGDQTMEQCAKTCRACARSCEQMAGAGHA